jgi:hypothetical protein
MSSVLLIYTPSINTRIKYIFSLFFESLINTPYKLTNDVKEYKSYRGPRLNYSENAIEQNEVSICSAELLFHRGICPKPLTVGEWDGLKILYKMEQGTIPFDIFAASFYLVTRYEEYVAPFEPDKHNRFRPTDSIAFKNQFIDQPLVNLWAEKLKAILLKTFPALSIKENTYTFTPTVDIDVAYAHKGRKLSITLGAYLKALVKFDFAFISNKTQTLLGLEADDYDTYAYQQEIFKKNNVHPIYFFLAGNRSTYDKNIATDSKQFAELIEKTSTYAEVGIHPSYQSLNNKEVVAAEMKRVADVLGEKITKSRQHYLRITLPDTYRCLAALGITDDYSMAYAACPGFRASICTPFYFYDIQTDEVMPVKCHPSIVMDGTLNEYINVTPDEAITLTQKLVEQVKQCKGEFVSIWHNDTLNDKGKWKGWKRVFETIVATAK